jgi:hypothetical protein
LTRVVDLDDPIDERLQGLGKPFRVMFHEYLHHTRSCALRLAPGSVFRFPGREGLAGQGIGKFGITGVNENAELGDRAAHVFCWIDFNVRKAPLEPLWISEIMFASSTARSFAFDSSSFRISRGLTGPRTAPSR